MSVAVQYRRRLAGPFGRWLLVGLVLAGIIGMHVLSEQDAGVGHGMVMTAQTMRSAHAGVYSEPDPVPMLMTDQAETRTGQVTASPATDGGMPGSMAMCLLFLAAGVAALALLLLRLCRTIRAAGQASVAGRGWGYFLRGPPRAASPRIALCILRV